AGRRRGRLPTTNCGVPLMRALTVRLLTGVAALGLLAGCSGSADNTTTAAPTFGPPMPVGVKDPAATPSAQAGGTTSCDVRHSSLRPEPGNPASGPTIAKIKARGRLIVGVNQNTYNFGYRDPKTGQIVGF